MKSNQEQVLKALTSGNAILLTGAGFSAGLFDEFGDSLPIGDQLARGIWPIAFGNAEFDGASLADVYHAAHSTSPGLLKDQLERMLTVSRRHLPPRFRAWFSLPWHRIYTLNLDDADEAVAESSTEANLQILSALDSQPGDVASDQTPVVHMNGRLMDFPNVTFSPLDFASRTATPDAWYDEFVVDIATRPVVIIGSVLDEPPLWHFMKSRELRSSGRELRPKSWLVSPKLDLGRKHMLRDLNFQYIPETEEEFFLSMIKPNLEELRNAKKKTPESRGKALLEVSEEIRSSSKGTADFLLGAPPAWGDVVDGYAAKFSFDEDLSASLKRDPEGAIAVVGSAGSGKTTSLMRAAAELALQNEHVLWLGRETEAQITDIRKGVEEAKPKYLFIDDIDRFGESAINLIRSLNRGDEPPVTVFASRSTRFYQLDYATRINLETTLRQERLTDNDAKLLLDSLASGKRLGALRELDTRTRIERLTQNYKGQLIVTLIEATSDERFHDRVAEECKSLGPDDQNIYGIACTAAWADNKPLTLQNLLFAASRTGRNEALQAVDRLVNSRLLIEAGDGYLPRHRVVAESAVNYFRDEGLISSWILDLIYLSATHYDAKNAQRSRFGRLLIRLLNHKNMNSLVADSNAATKVYGAAERWLDGDFHFWLQRGSYETDFGDARLADNFLKQARVLAPDDVFVETAWAQLLLKRSMRSPTDPRSRRDVESAFTILTTIMQSPVSRSPHTFAVFLQYGLQWLRNGQLGAEEAAKLREELERFGEKGRLLHKDAQDVQENRNAAIKWMNANQIY